MVESKEGAKGVFYIFVNISNGAFVVATSL